MLLHKFVAISDQIVILFALIYEISQVKKKQCLLYVEILINKMIKNVAFCVVTEIRIHI